MFKYISKNNNINPFVYLQLANFLICYLFFWKDIHIYYFICMFSSPLITFFHYYENICLLYYSITTLSSYTTIAVICNIKNIFLRKFLLFVYFAVVLTSLFGTMIFGQISSDMILATIGTDFDLVLSSIKTLDSIYLFLFLFSMLLIIFFIHKISRRKYFAFEKRIWIASMFFVIFTPLIYVFCSFNSSFIINNMKYSPMFVGNYYLKCSRVFWGVTCSFCLIVIENLLDHVRYKKINHEYSHKSILNHQDSFNQEENIILLIGESSNPKYYYPYNHNSSLTPKIKNLYHDNVLYIFPKVHSASSQTRTSVPMLLSFYSPTEKSMLFDVKNNIELAHDVGYNTYYISTQNSFSLWDKTYGFIANYANLRATPDKINNCQIHPLYSKDDTIIPSVEYCFKNKTIKNLYIIHIFGNHMPYDTNIDSDDNSLIDANLYEKSIHHTDKLIFKILNMADKYLKKYEFIYIPDHGEIVNRGHGFPTNDNEMYLVPCIMKKSKYCSILESYRRKDGWISSVMIKYILLQMMGYSFDDNIINIEIEKSKFILNEEEMLVDFSKLNDCSQ